VFASRSDLQILLQSSFAVKIAVSWGVILCSLEDSYICFGETSCVQFQDRCQTFDVLRSLKQTKIVLRLN
jgi:hypothetical protein